MKTLNISKMQKLLTAQQEIYDKIDELKKSIKCQDKVLKEWDQNNPLLLDKTKYQNELKNDMDKLEILIKSFQKLCDQIKKQITL